MGGSRPGGRPPVADSSRRGSRLTVDVRSPPCLAPLGCSEPEPPMGGQAQGRGAEGAHRGSTLQGLPGQPCAPGLSLQLLLLCPQLRCQLLGLKEAALQGVPLGSAGSHHTTGESPTPAEDPAGRGSVEPICWDGVLQGRAVNQKADRGCLIHFKSLRTDWSPHRKHSRWIKKLNTKPK